MKAGLFPLLSLVDRDVNLVTLSRRQRPPPRRSARAPGELRATRPPPRQVGRYLEILQTREADFEQRADAALGLVRAMRDGKQVPRVAYWQVLAWVYRNRRQAGVLELAQELARVDGREIALLGVGLVKYAETPEDIRVGRALFGLER